MYSEDGHSSYSSKTFATNLPKVRVPVRAKITLPYILLALIIAVLSAYIVTQLLLETLEDRFTNQLIELGKLSADRMVIEEEKQLEALRLIANVEGMAEAVDERDVERVRQLALPIAVNQQIEELDILDRHGEIVLSMSHRNGDAIETYTYTQGGDEFAELDFVQPVLQRRLDQGRDKYAGIAHMASGDFFYVSGPLKHDADGLIGVVLIGKSLDSLVKGFREETLAHTTLYNLEGDPLSSTLISVGQPSKSLTTDQVSNILTHQDTNSLIRDNTEGSVTYSEIMGPWEVRGGHDLGLIGAALPKTFLVNPSNTTRFQIMLIFSVGLLLVIITGVYISNRITRPLLEIVQASAKVADGDLDVAVQPAGRDEIAVLAHAFNHMVSGLHEVTERRLQEIELLKQLNHERELRELKSRFVSMVSHEFRTPLTAILSSSDYIRNYGLHGDPEKRKKHFNRIHSAVTNMTSLLEDVLFIGRTEAGRLDFNPLRLDLNDLCQGIVEEMQVTVASNHQLYFASFGESVPYSGDEKLLSSAITNLVSNAIKYSPNGSAVRLELHYRANQIVVQVQDEGIGVPEKDMIHLFDPFHRASNVGGISGTGLGLYITKMVVDLHNGIIEVKNNHEIGTTFTIRLPLAQQMEVAHDEYSGR
jgi:signal transduction histidine kinase